MIFASSIVPADSNFSMFNLGQAFAQTDFGPPGVKEGDILVITPFNGFICPFPGGERFGAVFKVDRGTGTTTKIFDTCPHGPVTGFPDEHAEFEIDIAIDPVGNTYVLDSRFAFFNNDGSLRRELGAVFQALLPCLDEFCDLHSVLTSNFNIVQEVGPIDPGLGPVPVNPWAMDTSSSGQVYVIGVGFSDFLGQFGSDELLNYLILLISPEYNHGKIYGLCNSVRTTIIRLKLEYII